MYQAPISASRRSKTSQTRRARRKRTSAERRPNPAKRCLRDTGTGEAVPHRTARRERRRQGARRKKYGSGVPQVFMCRIIWQCTLTPPQPSTAAMAGILNTPAAEAHPPVTSSVQPRSKFAQSGRRSRGIYWAAQANMTIHAHIEIIFFVPSPTASVSARESGRLEIAEAACASVSPCGMNRVSTPSVRLARVSDTKIMTPARTLPRHTRADSAYDKRRTCVDAEQGHSLRVAL